MVVHMLSGVALLLGALLFLRWAWLQKPAELMKWVKWLVIAGLIGSLGTAAFGIKGRSWKHKMMGKDGKMMEKMMEMEGMDMDNMGGSGMD